MPPKTAPTPDLPLSEAARHVIAPKGIKSTGWPKVRDTCRRLGWKFDLWQVGATKLILSKRADGTYAADTIVLSIPRQVGKTWMIAAIIFALCLLEPGLTVIWTAHRKTTAAETFNQFDLMAARPKVKAHVRQVMRGKGDEKILFLNGSRILFGARESGFGRGFSDVDILVLDEGQILKDDTLEDMGATQNVAKNPLTFLMGTPPRPKDPGEYFTLMREEALAGDSDATLYIEFSCDPDADPMDRAQWRKANPLFPRRTTERAMLRLRKKLKNDDSWFREALGRWDPISKHLAIVKSTRWAELIDVGPADDVRPDAMAVDMSHDRDISVTACWLEDDSAHGEEVWAGSDSTACVEWIVTVAGRRTPVVIDSASPASSMIPTLKARKVKVITGSANDMVKACGLVFDGFGSGSITHADQERVNDAVEGARRRRIGTAGGWGLDRTDPSVNIAPFVSWTLARFGAEVTRKKKSGGRGSRSTSGRRATVT